MTVKILKARDQPLMADRLVECHAGRHYPDRPLAFRWEDRRIEVVDVERQWRSQGASYDSPTLYYYRVLTSAGRFDLVYNVQADSWSIRELGPAPGEGQRSSG